MNLWGTIVMTRDGGPRRACPPFVLHITHEFLEHADPTFVVWDGPFVAVAGVGYLELVGDCPHTPRTWHAETRNPIAPKVASATSEEA